MIEIDKAAAQEGPRLRKNCLSFVENLAQAIGAMAPSGSVALTIPLAFASAGNATWLLYVMALGGYLLVGLNFGVFASRTSSPGALYHFTELGLGPTVGVVAGWAYVFGFTFSISSPALTFAHYAIVLCKLIPGATALPEAGFIFLLAAILVTCWISCRDVRLSTDLILLMECISVGLMLVLAWAFLSRVRSVDLPQLKLTGATLNGFRVGSVLALFSMTGFESATTLGGESKKALQNIPRATIACLLPVGLLLILMSYVLVASFRGFSKPLDQTDAPFDHLASLCGLPAFGHLIDFGVLLSFFACTLGGLNAAARVLYAMARRGHFWPRAGLAHPSHATPHRALILVAAVSFAVPAVLMTCGSTLDACIDYTSQLGSFGFFASYLLICLAAPVYLQRRGELRAGHLVLAGAAILVLSVPLLSFFYPFPDAPSRYFPGAFAVLVAAASAASLRFRSSKASGALAVSP
jgi:amino acid transporter